MCSNALSAQADQLIGTESGISTVSLRRPTPTTPNYVIQLGPLPSALVEQLEEEGETANRVARCHVCLPILAMSGTRARRWALLYM